jgi:cell shape-determining protein MreD
LSGSATHYSAVVDSAPAFEHHRPVTIDRHIRPRHLILAGVLVAIIALGIDGKFGPQPLVWSSFRYGTVVIHLPWLMALCLISATTTFLARRWGTSLSQRVLVALGPAIIIGGLACVLMAAIVLAAAVGGHRVYPRDFVGHMLVGWILIPLAAALVGGLPFLWQSRVKTNAGEITA